MEVRRVNLVNLVPRTSPKFITGVKYQFHQGFRPDQRSGNRNHPSLPILITWFKNKRNIYIYNNKCRPTILYSSKPTLYQWQVIYSAGES